MSDLDEHHTSGLADILDLDAEVFADEMAGVRRDIDRLADAPVRTVLDLGAGTGVGTFGLLQHFPEARAVALDASDEMLDHLVRRAEHLGLRDRVTPHRADLDVEVPPVGPVDLVWASASLHHLVDPDRTLTQLTGSVRPGGLLVVLELTGFPRFVPDDGPGGAAEAQAHALMAADRARHLPAMGSDWGERLERAGWHVDEDRPLVLHGVAPGDPVVGRYAFASLSRVRQALADRLAPDDLAGLDALLDGGDADVRRRDDLRVAGERRLLVARRARARS